MSDWSFRLGYTENMSAIGDITDASNKSLDIVQSRPGGLKFTYPMEGQWGDEIEEHTRFVQAIYNGVPLWSGPIWNVEEDYASANLSVSCLGWLQDLYRRVIRVEDIALDGPVPGGVFNLIPSDQILAALLYVAQNQKDNDGLVRPTRLQTGSSFITDSNFTEFPKFSRTLQKGEKIGDLVQLFSDIENGYDLDVDPITRELNVYYPRRGELRPMHLGFNAGPNNLKNVRRSFDSTKQANRINVTGKFGYVTVEDTTSMNRWGVMLEEDLSMVNETSPTMLAAYGNAEIAIRSNPFVVNNLELYPSSDENIPIFGKDFLIGDLCKFSAVRGNRITDRQLARIFSVSLAFDAEGNASISNFQITPTGT